LLIEEASFPADIDWLQPCYRLRVVAWIAL
jgi:hypothetical protein